MDISDQITQIEEEIRKTPYHKGTEHHIGRLRARLVRLKDKEIESEVKSKGGGGGGGYAVKKHGDATVVLVGPPSAGKSTLINQLTNASSKVAEYAFTTTTIVPGMMEYKNARIQIMDAPGLIEGAEKGKGRGKEVLSAIRGADLILIMTDISRINAFTQIVKSLEGNGIRINKKRPDINIEKAVSGGIVIHSNIKQELGLNTIKDIINEMGLKNGEITIKQKISLDELIDSLSHSRVYIPAIFAVNKSELLTPKEMYGLPIYHTYENKPLFISAENGLNLNLLKEEIWKGLKFIRVYLVKKDEDPNENNPIICRLGQSLFDLSMKLGEGFSQKIDHGVIWGPGAKFPAQEVSLTTQLVEGMMIRFV